MKKKYIVAIIAFVVTLSITVLGVVFFIGDPVENEEKAMEIAKTYILKKYDNSFDEYKISAELDGNVWIVSYGIPPVYAENGELVEATLGGGGPAVKISKTNGRIIRCLLQQ